MVSALQVFGVAGETGETDEIFGSHRVAGGDGAVVDLFLADQQLPLPVTAVRLPCGNNRMAPAPASGPTSMYPVPVGVRRCYWRPMIPMTHMIRA